MRTGRETLLSLLFQVTTRSIIEIIAFPPLFLPLILFSRSKRRGGILKNLKNEAPMGIEPRENLDPSFGEKFIAFIPGGGDRFGIYFCGYLPVDLKF